MKIAILGGTGKEGAGLGWRWAYVGHEVVIGSRTAEKAQEKATELNSRLPAHHSILGTDNNTAAQMAELIVLSVPYTAQKATLEGAKDALAGKLLVTVVVPLQPPKVSRVWIPPTGSAAQEAQQLLGEQTRVVAAFQNVSAEHLTNLEHQPDCDVLICGDKAEDRELVAQLAKDAGMRGVHAGPLQNAVVAEGLTAVLIAVNMRYKIKNAGIRLTGVPL